MAVNETARYLFDSLGSAADGLITVLKDARDSKLQYSFGGLSAQEILSSGLVLQGDLSEVAPKLDAIVGAMRSPQ